MTALGNFGELYEYLRVHLRACVCVLRERRMSASCGDSSSPVVISVMGKPVAVRIRCYIKQHCSLAVEPHTIILKPPAGAGER